MAIIKNGLIGAKYGAYYQTLGEKLIVPFVPGKHSKGKQQKKRKNK